ncbi:MAG: hypothetical protein E7397_09165 [Ruminococcaceae bacterium]|nr:hypothetical protein [Oscillospiraceae bacterium]
MIGYIGEKEQLDFFQQFECPVSGEFDLDEVSGIIVNESSMIAADAIRTAAEKNIAVLAVLDGFESLISAFGGELQMLENCAEGKQELAVINPETPLYYDLERVISICRGTPATVSDLGLPPVLGCVSRSESGEIIAVEYLPAPGKVYGINFYLNSSLTPKSTSILQNFFKLCNR